MNFRDATLNDVAELVALIESAYRGESSRAGWTTEADLLDGQRTDCEEVSALIARESSRIRVAVRDRQIIGCVRVDRFESAGTIGMFAVQPSLQNDGIGRALLVDAERIIRDEWHLDRARMTVIAQRNTLLRWYERRGYILSGLREPFPYGEPRFGIPRMDGLYFEVIEKRLGSEARSTAK